MKIFLITYINEHGQTRYETLQADVSEYMEKWHAGRSYTFKEVEFPEPPQRILRPDWTRKIGSVWKAPSLANAIYMLVDENTVMAFYYESKRTLTFSVWDDNSEIWFAVRRVE